MMHGQKNIKQNSD